MLTLWSRHTRSRQSHPAVDHRLRVSLFLPLYCFEVNRVLTSSGHPLSVGAFLATMIIDLWPVHRHTLRTAPTMHVGRFGLIHGMWMPHAASTSSASQTYVPVPPRCGVLRFPPKYAGSGGAPDCGVQVVPLARASG